MESAPNLGSFLRAPLGRYVQGEGWLCFYPTPHLSGLSLWGTIAASKIEVAATISPEIHRLGLAPRVGVIDARHVEEVEPAAFQIAAQYVVQHQTVITSLIERVAVVHHPGLMAAVTAGFFSFADPSHLVRAFTDAAEAAAWLGVPGVAEVLTEVERIRARVADSPYDRELRTFLAGTLRVAEPRIPATLAECARALGISSRSLQRRLSETGTSFRRELTLVRLERAQELLSTTSLSIGEVAFQVGCASEQNFSRMFRRATGESPARWRRQGKT